LGVGSFNPITVSFTTASGTERETQDLKQLYSFTWLMSLLFVDRLISNIINSIVRVCLWGQIFILDFDDLFGLSGFFSFSSLFAQGNGMGSNPYS